MELYKNTQETTSSQPSHPAHPAPPIHPLQSVQSHQSAQLSQLAIDDVTQRAYPPLLATTDTDNTGQCVVCGVVLPACFIYVVDLDGRECEPTCRSCLGKKRVGEILGIKEV